MNQKEVLIISITVFITVVAWIVSDLVHVSETIRLPENEPHFREPINVHVDLKLIDELESRTY